MSDDVVRNPQDAIAEAEVTEAVGEDAVAAPEEVADVEEVEEMEEEKEEGGDEAGE